MTETHTVMVPVTRTVTDTEYRDVPESVIETHIKRVPVTRTVTTTEYRQQPVTVTETVQEPRYETVQMPVPPPKDLDTRGYWRRWLAHPFRTVTRFVGYFARTVTRTEMRTVPVQVQKTVTEYEERPVTTTVTRLVRRAVPVTRQETVMEPRTVTETRQVPVDPPPPAPPQSRRRSAAELVEERDPQRNAKVVPLFPPGSKPTEQELNQLILQAKQEYDTAQAQGNAGGMQAAHQRAEWLRSLGGTHGAGQSTAEVQEREVDRLNADILQAKANYAAAAARGDAKGMASAHDRAEELRRQGGTVAAAETLDEAKLHLQTDIDRHITQDKAHYAGGTAADQRLAQQRAEDASNLAEGVGVQTIGADVTLADAREQAQAEANRQVVIDKAVYDRAQAAGDAASMKLAHQDAEAQRAAGAVVGSGENQQQARDHLQQILDTGIVTHKDAWQSTTDQAARTHEHRQADVFRQVGQSVGVGTIGQEAALSDALVRLVLEGGPLVAGGKATDVKKDHVAALQAVQQAVDGGQPDLSGMRDLSKNLQARANAEDASAAAALAVLQRQADKAGVDLNPAPPSLRRADEGTPDSGVLATFGFDGAVPSGGAEPLSGPPLVTSASAEKMLRNGDAVVLGSGGVVRFLDAQGHPIPVTLYGSNNMTQPKYWMAVAARYAASTYASGLKVAKELATVVGFALDRATDMTPAAIPAVGTQELLFMREVALGKYDKVRVVINPDGSISTDDGWTPLNYTQQDPDQAYANSKGVTAQRVLSNSDVATLLADGSVKFTDAQGNSIAATQFGASTMTGLNYWTAALARYAAMTYQSVALKVPKLLAPLVGLASDRATDMTPLAIPAQGTREILFQREVSPGKFDKIRVVISPDGTLSIDESWTPLNS